MKNVDVFQIRKKSPASLTALRFKRVQHFRIVSVLDPEMYGQLGSSKWGDELHGFLADKRIAREDVQRWMETNSQVTEPFQPHTENQPEQLWSSTGRALRTSRHPEVIQIQRPPTASSSAPSTDSKYSGDTVVSVRAFNSAKHLNCGASTNPIFFNDAPTQASSSNVQESSGILNLSAHSAASKSSQNETQNDCMPLDLSNRATATAQQPEVSPGEVILKDVAIGFGALLTLVQLANKYEKIPRPIHLSIRSIYKNLEQFQKFNVVPRIPEPFVPECKEEVELNDIEMDGDMNDQYFETVEEINMVTVAEPTDGDIMDTQAIDLSMKSNPGDFGGNFMNNQGDNDQIEENDMEENQAENFDCSQCPDCLASLN